MNPNSKIPAMYDYSFSPPIRLFESAAIILHIAEQQVLSCALTPNTVELVPNLGALFP